MLFKYFDLNLRAHGSNRGVQETGGAMRHEEDEAFLRKSKVSSAPEDDAQSSVGTDRAPSIVLPQKPMPLLHQLVVYIGVVLGVLFSSAVQQFRAGKGPVLALPLGVVVTAVIVGLVLFPQVYEKLRLRADLPLLVHLGLALQNGVFWQVLFTAIGKAVPGGD